MKWAGKDKLMFIMLHLHSFSPLTLPRQFADVMSSGLYLLLWIQSVALKLSVCDAESRLRSCQDQRTSTWSPSSTEKNCSVFWSLSMSNSTPAFCGKHLTISSADTDWTEKSVVENKEMLHDRIINFNANACVVAARIPLFFPHWILQSLLQLHMMHVSTRYLGGFVGQLQISCRNLQHSVEEPLDFLNIHRSCRGETSPS